MPPKLLRLLVDLEALLPGGLNGGIKPALREQFRWLGAQTEQPFEFVYLCRAEVAHELHREWMRPNDRLIITEDATPDIAMREHCNLVYGPFGMTRWACAGIPTVKMEVDVLHRDYPESLSEQERRSREEHYREAVEKADFFQVISDYTGRQLTHYYGVDPKRIVRTYLPIQGRLRSRINQSNPSSLRTERAEPYFFYPANAWAHKNHITLLMAYALYRDATQQANEPVWRLVLTGADDAAMRSLQSLAQSLCLGDHVDFKGFVDETTLDQLWENASALVFPSLHEGFGIPLLEAMYYCVPILAADAAAIPEVGGEAALLVDARSPLKLSEAMRRLANDPALRDKLVAQGKTRIAQLDAGREFGKLIPIFRTLAQTTAQPKSPQGYYPFDRLTGPNALFSVPTNSQNPKATRTLAYEIEPLGVRRTVKVYADGQHLDTWRVAAKKPKKGKLSLAPAVHSLRLHTVDASRVSEADPRTLGIRLTKLDLHAPGGQRIDLLQGV